MVQKETLAVLYLWCFGIAIAGGLRVFNIEDFGAKSNGKYSAPEYRCAYNQWC